MLKQILILFVGLLIRLRYRVHVEGLKELQRALRDKKKILVLPNHVASIDPVILMQVLLREFDLRPIVVDDYFYGPGLKFLMKIIRALPCPNMDHGVNRWKIHQLEKLQDTIVQGLKKGENYLIYPSGKLKVTEKEIIGGASMIPQLLNQVPDAQVVLIRSTGLWGSRFSNASPTHSPQFGKNLWESLGILIKNFVFFAPRRTVKIEVCMAPGDFPSGGDRNAINHYLESWYNAAADPLTRVSYSFWKEDLLPIAIPQSRKTTPRVAVPENIKREVVRKLSEMSGTAAAQITEDTQLVRDLGFDSLDVAQFILFLDEKYEIGQIQPESTATVEDFLQMAAKLQESSQVAAEKEKRPAFREEKNRPLPLPPQGGTIIEAFFRAAERMPHAIACADATAGALSYRKLKMGVLVLAEEIRKMPGKNIGILLPSSVGAYVTILATLCAGKVPVMLNWTVGARAVNHAVKSADVQVILSSRRFLTRVANLDIGSAEDQIVLLEDVRMNISLRHKLRGLVLSFLGADALLRKENLHTMRPSETAVILFTSGTETLPKGVPLSHSNILSNQTAAQQVVELLPTDILYGILPPFHSFGFAVTGLLPLVSGLKVFYAPDPTNHRRMARDLAIYKCTLFWSAPTFIRNVFHTAAPEDLRHLRLIVSGAEKAEKELFNYVRDNIPGAQFLEGYGITECSPVVSLCRPGVPAKGVGYPLPGVELLILDTESGEECDVGKDGEVCIAGPSVFDGYLDKSKNPFIEKKGKRWYRSGDRGSLTSDGALVLSGRLKRFVKIGGEMVSLAGLEEEITVFIGKKGDEGSPSLAVCAMEKEGQKTLLVLFTTQSIDKEDINIFLKSRGHSNLMRLSEVRTLEQIPLTGTGKTNYRLLEEMFEKKS